MEPRHQHRSDLNHQRIAVGFYLNLNASPVAEHQGVPVGLQRRRYHGVEQRLLQQDLVTCTEGRSVHRHTNTELQSDAGLKPTLQVGLFAQQVADGGLELRVFSVGGVDVRLTVSPEGRKSVKAG